MSCFKVGSRVVGELNGEAGTVTAVRQCCGEEYFVRWDNLLTGLPADEPCTWETGRDLSPLLYRVVSCVLLEERVLALYTDREDALARKHALRKSTTHRDVRVMDTAGNEHFAPRRKLISYYTRKLARLGSSDRLLTRREVGRACANGRAVVSPADFATWCRECLRTLAEGYVLPCYDPRDRSAV